MAAPTPTDMRPDSWITDYAFATPNMTIPNTTITDAALTDAECAVDADIREILYSLCEHFYIAYDNMSSSDTPTYMTISRAQSVNNTTNRLTKTYTFQFVCDPSGVTVVDES